jgi:hypothetical protein
MFDFKSLLEEAKANRSKYLAPHKERFEKTSDPQIIIDLIKEEPSHLEVPWILWEVIEWLRQHDCIDLVKEAFVAQGERDRPTEGEKIQEARDYFLSKEIDRIIEEAGVDEMGKKRITRQKAYRELANRQADNPRSVFPMWDEANPAHDLEGVIKKADRRHREKQQGRKLPYPYYGLDVIDKDEKIVLRG